MRWGKLQEGLNRILDSSSASERRDMTEEKRDRVESFDLHNRVHNLERWQVGVDYFMEGQKEVNQTVKNMDRKMSMLIGAVTLATFVIPVAIRFFT